MQLWCCICYICLLYIFVIYRCTNDAWEGESMTRMGAVRALLLFAAVIGLCHRHSRFIDFALPLCGRSSQVWWPTQRISSILRRSEETPSPPSSAKSMVQQAADSVMKAYADGISRQSVQLRLDIVCPPNRVIESGMEALLNAALPMAKAFTTFLGSPGGAPLKDVRISRFDGVGTTSGDVGTLLYRVSEDPKQDVAVVFLGGRKFVLQDDSDAFINGMKSRLVVMLNSEDSATTFRLENKGQEVSAGGNFGNDVEVLGKFCETFREETYYLRLLLLSDWPVLIFRAYPNPWEVYLEALDGDVVRLFGRSRKPRPEEILQEIAKYEEENGITNADKMAKIQR
ncbi:unnamed protein product [Effrenium voratum]|nr:unnamed protein product [Effrenium voratum]